MTQLLTEAQHNLLTAVLNCLIPAEGVRPGARDLQIANFVEEVVASKPNLRRLFTDGLAQIEITANNQANAEFGEINQEKQEAVLREVQNQNPAFFDQVLRQCYNGYYTNPQVQDLIGYEKISAEDYQYTPHDESLLEPQRQRAPFWTRV